MRKQPLLLCCVFFISGILVCENVNFGKGEVLFLFSISFLLFIFGFLRVGWLLKLKKLFILLFSFCLGIFCHFFNQHQAPQIEFSKKEKVVFELQKKLNSNTKNKRYEVLILTSENKKFVPFKGVFSIPKTEKSLDFDHYYQAEIYLNKVEPPQNDFQFNYAEYLSRRDIFYQGFVAGNILESKKDRLSLAEKIKQKRLKIISEIELSEMNAKSKEFLKGIILADRTEMDSETVSDFSKTGLVHLLAISGTHMVVIFGLLMMILKIFFHSKRRNLAILLSLIFIWFFTVFIDYGSSVVRSSIMISMYYGFVLLQRKPDLIHSMALAAFLILFFDTNQIFDVGFQLSFIAVSGIYWLNDTFLKFLPKPKNDFQKILMNIPSVSLSAQIATLPLVIYYFHQYSFISILANLIIIPFSEIIIVLSLFLTIFFAFAFDFSVISSVYDEIIQFLLKVIHGFASFDFLYFENISMNLFEMIALLVSAYFLRFFLEKKNFEFFLKLALSLFVFFGLRVGLNLYYQNKNEIVEVAYLNDKTLIFKKQNKVFFYQKNLKNEENFKKFIVKPYLSSRRVTEFEMVKIADEVNSIQINGKTFFLE